MRAVVPPTLPPSLAEEAFGALEEWTGGKTLLVLLGVGIVGGGLYYLTSKKSAAAATVPGTAPLPNTLTTAPAPSSGPPPTVTSPAVLRPTAQGHFSQSPIPVPPGQSAVLLAGGITSVILGPADYVTLTLPSGASQWNGVFISNSANPSGAQVLSLGADTVSPISIPMSLFKVMNANAMVVGWTGAAGAVHASVLIAAK